MSKIAKTKLRKARKPRNKPVVVLSLQNAWVRRFSPQVWNRVRYA